MFGKPDVVTGGGPAKPWPMPLDMAWLDNCTLTKAHEFVLESQRSAWRALKLKTQTSFR